MSVNWPNEKELLSWIENDLRNWYKWGNSDQKGTLNFIDSKKTLSSIKLVQEGFTVSCSGEVDFNNSIGTPKTPQHFMISAGDNYRENENNGRQVAMDYFGMVFHGHSVTHIDSLSHFFWNGRTFNGRPSNVVTTSDGATEFDVMPSTKGIVSKGVLIDVPYIRNVEYLERGDGVTLEDIKIAIDKFDLDISEGDILLLRTGQMGQIKKYGSVDVWDKGSSGPSPEILPFIYEKKIASVGSDTGNDILPNPYDKFTNPFHQVGIVAMGLWILDNLCLDELAEECIKRQRWEFCITVNPLKLPSVTGSPVNPIVIF